MNKTTEKEFDFKPAVKRTKISLAELPLGTYTVMFYQADKIIVFQIDRLLPFDYQSALETDVAMNDDDEFESDVASADIDEIDLDFDTANLGAVANNADKDFKALEDKVAMTYNLTEPNRSKVQTRAEYRRTHLRPNGKPYNN